MVAVPYLVLWVGAFATRSAASDSLVWSNCEASLCFEADSELTCIDSIQFCYTRTATLAAKRCVKRPFELPSLIAEGRLRAHCASGPCHGRDCDLDMPVAIGHASTMRRQRLHPLVHICLLFQLRQSDSL